MVTYFLMWVLTEIYALCLKSISKAIQWPTKDTFLGWSEYMRISLPSTVMLLAEGWAFNVLGVLAGLISVEDQAANTILLMVISIMFMVPMGVQSAACAIVGEQIGANNVSLAKGYLRLMSIICFAFLVVIQLLVIFNADAIVSVFTQDEGVKELAKSTMWIVVWAFTADMI